MVLYVYACFTAALCLRAGARPPRSSSWAPGASSVVPEARGGGFLAAPAPGRGARRRPARRRRGQCGLHGNDPTPTGVLAYSSEAPSFVRVRPERLACLQSPARTTAFVTPSWPRALEKTHTSSAAARCEFVQSSSRTSRQHMLCVQSLSHLGGTASCAMARRRTPSWAL